MSADSQNVLSDVLLFPEVSSHIGQRKPHVYLIYACQVKCKMFLDTQEFHFTRTEVISLVIHRPYSNNTARFAI